MSDARHALLIDYILRHLPPQKHRLLSFDTFSHVFSVKGMFVNLSHCASSFSALRRSVRMRTCYGCCGTYLYFFFLFCIYATIGELC